MEALAVIAGIVGLFWGLVVFLRGGLLGGCLAVLLAGTCFSVPFFKIELGPLPLTADRLLLVLLVGQYVLWRRWGLARRSKTGGQAGDHPPGVHRRDGHRARSAPIGRPPTISPSRG